MAGPSSVKDTDSVFDDIEDEWRAEDETRSGGGNERGAENSEEEDWRDTQWEVYPPKVQRTRMASQSTKDVRTSDRYTPTVRHREMGTG